jgi:hypothetical protein
LIASEAGICSCIGDRAYIWCFRSLKEPGSIGTAPDTRVLSFNNEVEQRLAHPGQKKKSTTWRRLMDDAQQLCAQENRSFDSLDTAGRFADRITTQRPRAEAPEFLDRAAELANPTARDMKS